MSLWFQPKPRSVLYCDFAGFRVPEMTKKRPVVVLRAHKRNRRLVYVIPLSTSPPQHYHFHFARSPVEHAGPTEAWAKCDMMAIVSTDRLSTGRWRHDRRADKNALNLPMISQDEFEAIRQCVAKAFGFGAGSYIRDVETKEPESVVDSE